MSSESVCQVAHSWVDVDSFHMYLVVRFMIFIASVWNILDTPSYDYINKLCRHQVEMIWNYRNHNVSALVQEEAILRKYEFTQIKFGIGQVCNYSNK
jgi:hypothetical protein